MALDYKTEHLIEDLTARLHVVEAEEKQLEEKLEKIRTEKSKIMEQLKENTTESYQVERLAALYEQRRKK